MILKRTRMKRENWEGIYDNLTANKLKAIS